MGIEPTEHEVYPRPYGFEDRAGRQRRKRLLESSIETATAAPGNR